MKKNTSIFRIFLLASIISVLSLYMCPITYAIAGTGKILWQIGVVDSLYYEFGQNVFSEIQSRVNHFTIGKDISPARWSATLAAVPIEQRGKAASQEVEFTISDIKNGLYELTLNCVFRHPLIPHVWIEVNSHPGHFAFAPQRISRVKDAASKYTRNFSFESAKIYIPSEYLKQGANTLKLTAHTEPALPLDSLTWEPQQMPGGGYKSGGIYWDALIFSEPSGSAPGTKPYEVAIQPTIFYVRQDGRLWEWVHAAITMYQPIPDGSITLTTGNVKSTKKLSLQYAFGTIHLPFMIPADDNVIPAQWAIESSGETFSGEVAIKPAKKWKLFVTPRAHLDIGYTEGQSACYDVHTHSIDKAFKLIEKYPDYRWNVEGTLVVDEYKKNHSEKEFQKLIQFLRDEKIGMNSLNSTPLSVFFSLEEMFRANHTAMKLRHTYGVPIKVTSIVDVPSSTMAIADVLSHLDIPYLVISRNPTRGHPLSNLMNRDNITPVYWKGLGDGKVVLLYTDHFASVMVYFGAPADVQVACDQISLFLQHFTNSDYQPDAVMVYGSHNDNNFIRNGEADFLSKWNTWFEYPKVIMSADREFFDYIVSNYPGYLRTLRGDGGSYWEDGIGSSIRETVMARQAKFQMPDAEKVFALTTPFYRAASFPLERVQKIWDDIILYTEHTWGSNLSTREPQSFDAQAQWKFKQLFARNAVQGTSSFMESGLKQLEGILTVPDDAIIVYNPCNWVRSDWVNVEPTQAEWIFDEETGKPVTGEIMSMGKTHYKIRFLAENVPPLGARIYSIKKKAPGTSFENRKLAENSIETPFYRITLDQNKEYVKSIVDLQTGQELIDQASNYTMNQYLYVMGGEDTPIVTHDYMGPQADLKVMGSYAAKAAVIEKTPAGWLVTLRHEAPHTPSITSEMHLYEIIKRIDIQNSFRKKEADKLEAVYFAFPFSFSRPNVHYDTQTGWIDPRKDLLEGACNEWFTHQYGAMLSDDTKEVLWASPDVPLVCFGDIVRGKWPMNFTMENGTIFSYVLNNYWFTNYQWLQSGDYELRYSFTSGKKEAPDMRLRQALEIAHPLRAYDARQVLLEPDKMVNGGKRHACSFINIGPEQVYCVTIKGAEDGRGYICRLLNLADYRISAAISSDVLRISGAAECKGDESDVRYLSLNEGKIQYELGPHQLATIRLYLQAD